LGEGDGVCLSRQDYLTNVDRMTYDRVFLGVLVPRLGLVIPMMSRGNDLDHATLLEDPAGKVVGESGVSSLEPDEVSEISSTMSTVDTGRARRQIVRA
jgi:hypothetical protein